ncbi:MAG: transposase [Chloroflexi bacterium]|nr:transposase [Chloroflexota bacterium]
MRRIRLHPDAYRTGHCLSVTVAVTDRVRLLDRAEAAETALEALRGTARRYAASVFAYCLMPDHVHLLVALPDGESLVDFIRDFKQLSSFRIKRLAGKPIAVWQQRFYDHALRSPEALEDAAQYIWNNPLRAGVVSDPSDYLYSGSFVWEGVLLGSEDPDLHDANAHQPVKSSWN